MRNQVVLICIVNVLLEVSGFSTKRGKLKHFVFNIPDADSPIVYKPFEQVLDHFNESDDRTWRQRSWSNAEWVNSNDSPIFLFVDGESESNSDQLQQDAWYMWAEKYNAMMYQLEHRFYGRSHPTKDVSTKSLRYLSSEQAIADIAHFIQETNNENGYTDKNKWILFGGSYPGNLVAWSRLHHPELIYGAVSSSAPLQAKSDFFEYADVMRDSLNNFVPGCADVVTQGYKSLQESMKTESGVNQILEKFKYCSEDFDSSYWLDTSNFYFRLSSSLRSIVQYNEQEKNNITDVCNDYIMNESLGDPVDRLAALHNKNSKPDADCAPISNDINTKHYQNYKWSSSVVKKGDRQWLYQTCNEFGYGKTSANSDSLFSDTIPFNYIVQKCMGVFGDRFNEQHMLDAVQRVNKLNQGTDIKVTNVVFVQGSVDPWHPLGVIKNPTVDDPFVLINGTSHCYDMNEPKDSDNDSLKAARQLIDNYLQKWLTA